MGRGGGGDGGRGVRLLSALAELELDGVLQTSLNNQILHFLDAIAVVITILMSVSLGPSLHGSDLMYFDRMEVTQCILILWM